MGEIADTVRDWTWNIVQLVITFAVLGFAGMYLADVDGFRTKVKSYFVSCDGLRREIAEDDMCRRSEDCQLTRDELVESRDRVEKYDRYCSKLD